MFSRILHSVSSFFTLMTLASFVLLIGCSGQSPLAPASETGADKPAVEKSESTIKPALGSSVSYTGDDDEVPGDVGAYN